MTDAARRSAGAAGNTLESIPSSGDASLLARSVITNWLWYGLVLVSGFIIPRLINDYQSQEILGAWDFGWSVVIYIDMLSLGVAAALNRYVARYRAQGDWEALNSAVNSALAWLILAFALGVGMAIVFASLIPYGIGDGSREIALTGRRVLFTLSFAAALRMPFAAFNSVITGYGRFAALNAIRAARDGAALCLMIGLLVAGSGIVAMAIAVLLCELVGNVAKVIVAGRICTQLHISPKYCRAASMKEMLVFGGKTVLQDFSRGGIYQASSQMVFFFLGPATLAVYQRQRALVMHAMRFVKQYAQVFTPTSSVLHAQGDQAALQTLLIQTSKYGLYVALPIMLVLSIMGGPVLHVWMGPDFAAPAVLALLAGGHVISVAQLGAYSILTGMAQHGRAALCEFAAAVTSICMGLIILGPVGGGMIGAAIALTLPVAIVEGVVIPYFACKALDLNVVDYIRGFAPGPVLASIPLALCLGLSRWMCADNPVLAFVSGVGGGGLVTAAVYWRMVMPEPVRASVVKRIGNLTRRHKVSSG